MDFADALVFRVSCHGPTKGLVKAGDELVSCLGDKIGEPFGFDEEPEFFDGVEVRGIGQKIDGFERAHRSDFLLCQLALSMTRMFRLRGRFTA